VRYEWRGCFVDDEVNALHADAFGHRPFDDNWTALVERHSLGWVTARLGDRLVGFVNVIWDGLVHAWIQDEMVATGSRGRGIGRALVAVAGREAGAEGCEWLHVDFDDGLESFYYAACGFTPTNGGLIRLRGNDPERSL